MESLQNFVEWLETITGDKAVYISRRLNVSPTLLSLIRRGERPVSRRMADKISEVYGLDSALVYERAGFSFRPLASGPGVSIDEEVTDVDRLAAENRQLKERLAGLKDYRTAVAYALTGRLPAASLEKLKKIIALEIEYSEGKDFDAD